jgi:hypothetical protein
VPLDAAPATGIAESAIREVVSLDQVMTPNQVVPDRLDRPPRLHV